MANSMTYSTSPPVSPQQNIMTLQAALAYLMSRYSLTATFNEKGCQASNALAIVHHLEMLLKQSAIRQKPSLVKAYRALLADWQELAKHHQQEKELHVSPVAYQRHVLH